jgi:hypothetical protein
MCFTNKNSTVVTNVHNSFAFGAFHIQQEALELNAGQETLPGLILRIAGFSDFVSRLVF